MLKTISSIFLRYTLCQYIEILIIWFNGMMKHEFEPNIKYINYKNMCICQCAEHTQTYTHWQRHAYKKSSHFTRILSFVICIRTIIIRESASGLPVQITQINALDFSFYWNYWIVSFWYRIIYLIKRYFTWYVI